MGLLFLPPGEDRPHRLEGDSAHGAQHFGQMGAAENGADGLCRALVEARADGQALETGVGVGRTGADGVRRIQRRRHRLADGEGVIDGQPQVHFVQRLARRNVAAVMIVEGVGLEIDDLALDVEHAVFALIAPNVVGAFVDEFPLVSGGQPLIRVLRASAVHGVVCSLVWRWVRRRWARTDSGVTRRRVMRSRSRPRISNWKPWKLRTCPTSGIWRLS